MSTADQEQRVAMTSDNEMIVQELKKEIHALKRDLCKYGMVRMKAENRAKKIESLWKEAMAEANDWKEKVKLAETAKEAAAAMEEAAKAQVQELKTLLDAKEAVEKDLIAKAEKAEAKAEKVQFLAQRSAQFMQESKQATALHNADNRAERSELMAQQAIARAKRINAIANDASARAKQAELAQQDYHGLSKDADNRVQVEDTHIAKVYEAPVNDQMVRPTDMERRLQEAEERVVEMNEILKAAKERIKVANERAEAAEVRAKKAEEEKAAAGSKPMEVDDDRSVSSDDEQTKPRETGLWYDRFNQLRDHRITYGHCNVSQAQNSKLNNWMNNQRHLYRKSKTDKGKYCPVKAAKLENLGFDWGKSMPKPRSWKQNFEDLRSYKEIHGNCNVPICATTPSPLAKWVISQRIEYKHHKHQRGSLLTEDQIRQLNELGFRWRNRRR
jgi:hypothetical protein